VPASATRVVDLQDLVPAAPPTMDPAFREVVVNASAILRWEYALGSTAFLVYSRTQEGSRLRDPAIDAFLLKLSYWWG
jgi:hypothetical protein